MSIVTTYHDPIALTRKAAEDDIIIQATYKAAELAVQYGIESYKHNDKLGLCLLVGARRRKGNVDATYRNETAILNHYNMGI